MEVEPPDWALCPITHEKMSNPVVDPEGNSYEEGAILVWLRNKPISPITRRPLSANQLVQNRALKAAIEEIEFHERHEAPKDANPRSETQVPKDFIDSIVSDPRLKHLASNDFGRKTNLRAFEAFVDSLALELEIGSKISNLLKLVFFVPVYIISIIVFELPRFLSSFIVLIAFLGMAYGANVVYNKHARHYEKTLAIVALIFWAVIHAAVLNVIRTTVSVLPILRADIILRSMMIIFLDLGAHALLHLIGSELLKESPKISKILMDGS